MLVRMVVWRHNQNFDAALVQVNFIPGNIPLWLSTNCLLSSFFGWFWSDKYHVHIFDVYIFCICCKGKCKTTKIFSFYLIFLWLADAFLFIADQQMLRLLALSTFGTVLFLLLHWQMWKCTMLIHHDNNGAWNQNNYTNILLRYRMRIHTQELPQNLCAWVYDHAWVLATWYWQIGTTIQMVINTCNEFFGADSNLHKHHNHYSHINNALPLIL